MLSRQLIQTFSTQNIPQGERFDYWMSVLGQSLWPVSEWKVDQDFAIELSEAPLGCLSSMTETMGRSWARRSRKDVERSGERCYLLWINRTSWMGIEHKGRHTRLLPGDCVLLDSQAELETWAPSGFSGVILRCPVHWVNSWVPDPNLLVGRSVNKDSKWGNVLSLIVSQLTPELALAPPLPHGVLVDQLGATLALLIDNAETPAMPDLLKRIQDCIRQRCGEPQLTADDVAHSLNISSRDLHSTLRAKKLTFASQLIAARFDAGRHSLAAPSSSILRTNDVSHQASPLSYSQFSHRPRRSPHRTTH